MCMAWRFATHNTQPVKGKCNSQGPNYRLETLLLGQSNAIYIQNHPATICWWFPGKHVWWSLRGMIGLVMFIHEWGFKTLLQRNCI